MSSLFANTEKSEFYLGGVLYSAKHILQVTVIFKGYSPFRYLGLPLSAKRICHRMCQPLIW